MNLERHTRGTVRSVHWMFPIASGKAIVNIDGRRLVLQCKHKISQGDKIIYHYNLDKAFGLRPHRNAEMINMLVGEHVSTVDPD